MKATPRIFFCWELGGGRGHLYRILPLAGELVRRGCTVGCAVPDANRLMHLEEMNSLHWFQGPVWRPPQRKFPLSRNYAQNLLRNGYWHEDSLHGNISAWIALFERFQPDAIVAEHAPTALLAARTAGLRRAAIGTGFSIPPSASPMPSLQPWFSYPSDYLKKSEEEFVQVVNRVLQRIGSPALHRVADIFEGVSSFLCTLPELDHYGCRPSAEYLGPVLHTMPEDGASTRLMDPGGVFVYMSAANRYCSALFAALKESRIPVLAFLPGMDEETSAALESKLFRIAGRPVNLYAVARQCRFAVTQGGHNATALLLMQGLPLLLCPLHLEQQVMAYRLGEQGLATIVNYVNWKPDFKAKLESLGRRAEENPPARTFAEKYSGFNATAAIGRLADEFMALAGFNQYGSLKVFSWKTEDLSPLCGNRSNSPPVRGRGDVQSRLAPSPNPSHGGEGN